MNLFLTSGGPPPQKDIPYELSVEEMLLFAAWAHGMKTGSVAHRLALFAYVQSHIANKLEEPLQGVIENSKYWNGQGQGNYTLNQTGEYATISKFGSLPAQADLNAKYIFTRELAGRVFQTTVNPAARKLEPKVDNKQVNGVEACKLLDSLGATFVSPSTTSKPRKLLNWIVQDNSYSWQRLSKTSHVIHRVSEEKRIPESTESASQIQNSLQKTGQGYQVLSKVRQALEEKSMDIASEYFQKLGWKVTDVSKYRSYDLHCEMGSQELHVEVKGTTTDGTSVLLTPNEVTHAQQHYPNVALFIVSDLKVDEGQGASVVVEGGNIKLFQPWLLASENLTVIGYSYEVPKDE